MSGFPTYPGRFMLNCDGSLMLTSDGKFDIRALSKPTTVWKLDMTPKSLWGWSQWPDYSDSRDYINRISTNGTECLISGRLRRWIPGVDPKTHWKIDADGNSLWSWDIGPTSGVFYGSVAINSDGSFYTCGLRINNWEGSEGAWAALWKFDTDGNLLWIWDNGGAPNTAIYDVVTHEGGCYITGAASNQWPGAEGNWANIWKLDGSGNVLWYQYYGNIYDHSGEGISLSSDGSALYVGGYFSPRALMRLDPNDGTRIWGLGGAPPVQISGNANYLYIIPTDYGYRGMVRQLDAATGGYNWDWRLFPTPPPWGNAYGICRVGDDCVVVGEESSQYEGGDGTPAVLWRLDPNKNILAHWNIKQTCTPPTIYVVDATVNNIWIGGVARNYWQWPV